MLHPLEATKTFQQQSQSNISTRPKALVGISNVKLTTLSNASCQINQPVTSKSPNQTKANLAKRVLTNKLCVFPTCVFTTNPKQSKKPPQQATLSATTFFPQAAPKLKRSKTHSKGLIKLPRK
jgi:hypothetical protein